MVVLDAAAMFLMFFVVVFFIVDSRIQLKHRITDSLINL